MSAPRGYPSQEKDARIGKGEYSTVEPVRERQWGLSVNAHMFVRLVATDAVEASSTTSVINATAHSAVKGDIIAFTSGTHNGKEVKVYEVSANTITLAETLPSAPALAVTFEIYRHKYPTVDASGGLAVSVSSAPIEFTRNGSDQTVTKDTTTPANNRPLPVELIDTSGVTNQVTLAAGTNNIGDVDVVSSALPAGASTEATLSSLNSKVTTCNTGAVVVSSSALPSGAATEATLSTLNGKVTTVNTDAVTISTALPSGTNNIGDVDVLTLPSLPAGTNNIGDVDVLTLPSIPAGTNNIGDVDVLSLPYLDIVDFLDTPLLDASSTNIPGSASTPLTVVASLAAQIRKIQVLDTTGFFFGVYSDPAGTPVLEAIIGPGSDTTLELSLASTTVIGLRSMTTSAITSGNVAINFLG